MRGNMSASVPANASVQPTAGGTAALAPRFGAPAPARRDGRRSCRRAARPRRRAATASPLVVARLGGDVGEGRVGIALDGEVADRNDADGTAVLDDRDAPDVLLAHDADRVL